MINYVSVLRELVLPMVDNPEDLRVQTMDSINEDEILIYVYAKSDDIARLIGRGGAMATSIRQMMSIASRLDNKKISIKFESY